AATTARTGTRLIGNGGPNLLHLDGPMGDNVIRGGGSDDVLHGLGTVFGGSGDDEISATGLVRGGKGDDSIVQLGKARRGDKFLGEAGADAIDVFGPAFA